MTRLTIGAGDGSGYGAPDMDGYDERTYGDAFADVYDDWYADVSDVDATVTTLVSLAEGRPVLELGVGTGRLAVPLAEAGHAGGLVVSGVDTSAAMLERLRARDHDGLVDARIADMAGPLPGGPYGLVFVAYNTLFNLPSAEAQARCFARVAEVLDEQGRFVVEAFVPDDDPHVATDDISIRSLTADRVVLSVSRREPESRRAHGQFVEFTEAGGVRLRPWAIRYSTTHELDAMARESGFEVEHRWEQFDRAPFGDDSPRHVTVYRRR